MNKIMEAAHITPSDVQLKLQQLEFYGFIHFGMNTFTEEEWGSGQDAPANFNPTNLDTDQWVKAVKAAGMKAVILTTKHHDGFCLWPSAYTDYSVKSSPWLEGNGDVVRALCDSCKKYDIGFGVYLSPWDRHEATYGTDAYNDFFINQLTELLTNYGEMFTVWFDGACGEGKNGKKQIYDWERYYKTIRELQPNAAISIMGPDIRWCGNEAGRCRPSEWSVVPARLLDQHYIADNSQQDDIGELFTLENTDIDLGSRDKIMNEDTLIWYPSEVDTSIRPKWFYHKSDDDHVRTLDNLVYLYCTSVGGNNTLLLNLPPTKEGRLHSIDEKRLYELGECLENMFKEDLAADSLWEDTSNKTDAAPLTDAKVDTYWTGSNADYTEELVLKFGQPQTINSVLLEEYIEHGQRVENFTIECLSDDDTWIKIYDGTTVGYRKICLLDEVTTQAIRVKITQSRFHPELRKIAIYQHESVKIPN